MLYKRAEEQEDDIGRSDVTVTGFIEPNTLDLIRDKVCSDVVKKKHIKTGS